MAYLIKADITQINYLTISEVGGNFVPPNNFLHEENLDYLLEAVSAEMFGEPLYPTIHHKAGLYLFSIICNHIFQDGNTGTQYGIGQLILLLHPLQIQILKIEAKIGQG